MTPIIQQQPELMTEQYGEESYEYYPLGEYVVMALGVCGGRPTFKYSRIEVSIILAQLRIGRTVQEIVDGYHSKYLTVPAINEAITIMGETMKDEYDLPKMKSRRNPYVKRLKKSKLPSQIDEVLADAIRQGRQNDLMGQAEIDAIFAEASV